MSVIDAPAEERLDLRALFGAVGTRWLRIVLVTVALLGTTYAILMFVPKLYELSASILVEQRANAFTRSANEQQQANAVTMDSLMASQVELIKSRDNMLTVIDALKLRENPEFGASGFSPVTFILQLLGRKPDLKSLDQIALDNLAERVTVRRENTSSVVSVYVQSEDPQMAADIANAIANAHVKRRADLSIADTAEATVWLENEIAKLRVKVTEAETAVANYRTTNDLFQSGTGQTSILDQQLSTIATQITSAQERKNSAQSRAALICGLLQSGQAIDGVPDVRNSLAMQQLMQSRATLQGELAQRSSTLLANHPTIKALRAQIAAINSQITAEGRKVADALEAEAEVEASLEQSLNDDLARMKLSISTATRDTVTLDSLQREAKAQRDLLESYLARYSDAAARTDSSSTLPDVRVITVAAPSITPASPKTAMVLSAVGFLSVSLQVGAILFGELLSGRAVRRTEPTEPDGGTDEPDLFDDVGPEPVPAAAEHPFANAAVTRVEPQPEPAVAASAPIPEQVPPPPMPAEPVAIVAPPPPQPEPAVRTAGASALELSNLAADIAIGRVRVVMLAALNNFRDVEKVSELLIRSALDRGLSVATIDAGSARISAEPGLTDLAAEKAGFGDVVHKVSEGVANVPWGHRDSLERRSMKPVTLIEALTDIYEVVIVKTGRIGVTSTLPVFSGIDCRLVMVAGDQSDRETVQSALAEAATLGYEVGQMVSAPAQRSVA